MSVFWLRRSRSSSENRMRLLLPGIGSGAASFNLGVFSIVLLNGRCKLRIHVFLRRYASTRRAWKIRNVPRSEDQIDLTGK